MIGSKDMLLEEQQTLAYIDSIAEEVEQGRKHALEEWRVLDLMEKGLKEAKKRVKPHALYEASQQDEKTFEHNGCKFERRTGRSNWNYKSMPDWVEKKAELTEIEKEGKARYALYQKGKLAIDEETGESMPVPTVTYSDDSLIVKS